MKRVVVTASIVTFNVLTLCATVRAQDVAAASGAYSRAQAAELQGRHRSAAELFELADAIAPTPEALRSALRARRKAGDDAIAASHAERLLVRDSDGRESRRLARRTLSELSPQLTRHEVLCGSPCTLSVDGGAVGSTASARHRFYTEPGRHTLTAVFSQGQSAKRIVVGDAGRQITFEIKAPPPSKSQRVVAGASGSTQDHGTRVMSPAFAITGAVLAAGLAAATVWSGVDVQNQHETYLGDPTIEGYENGVDSERRTNILLGAAIGTAAVTAVIAAFFTDWAGGEAEEQPPSAVRFGVSPSGASLAWQKRY